MLNRLQDFADKHDKIAHFLLAVVLTVAFELAHQIWWGFNWSHAITFLVCIELTQIDIFGIKNRIQDIVLDLLADGTGIVFGLLLIKIVRMIDGA